MNLTYLLTYKRSTCKIPLLKKIYSLLLRPIVAFNGSYIGSGAQFKNIPSFPHGITGVFISSGAKIGLNCVIFHQVTIGSNTIKNSNRYGAPTIGDNVYIGAGAKIIGNVYIGNNVRIGANAVVVTDIPDNATVVNQPSRIIVKNENRDNSFASFK